MERRVQRRIRRIAFHLAVIVSRAALPTVLDTWQSRRFCTGYGSRLQRFFLNHAAGNGFPQRRQQCLGVNRMPEEFD
jgi:hypothetical protein